MPRDNAETKARRYLTEGRLIVLAVDRGRRHIDAWCRGDGDHYHLGYDPTRGWWCDCPARTDRCAHLCALRLVTVKPNQTDTASKRRER
jgi:hypothetical protein